MFYNITRHLLKSISNLIILTFGFAFGFFIMHHRTDSHSFQVSSTIVPNLRYLWESHKHCSERRPGQTQQYIRNFGFTFILTEPGCGCRKDPDLGPWWVRAWRFLGDRLPWRVQPCLLSGTPRYPSHHRQLGHGQPIRRHHCLWHRRPQGQGAHARVRHQGTTHCE